jgi:putative peptidoglycan lipid II flippase
MGPAVIAASAVQVNVLVNGNFASYLGNGAVAALGYAFRLMQLPLGIFGVAVGTVTLPLVSRFASTHDTDGVRSTLGHGMRLAFLLTVPCAVGLIFFAEPIISLIYQRGKFSFGDTAYAAGALQCYAVGLVAYSGIKVLAPAFYALDKRNLPMLVSFLSIGTNYLLNLFITFRCGLGIRGLALSTSLVAVVNFAILYLLMRRHIGGLETRRMTTSLGKLVVACIPLALVCIASQHWIFGGLAQMAFVHKMIAVFGTIGVGMVVFFGTVALMGIEEVEDVIKLLKRKLGRA